MSVAFLPGISSAPTFAPKMISPTTTAPISAPTNAPTIPPQKRSGSQIVKCQIARPIITQPSMPISAHPPRSAARSSLRCPSARPAVTFVARAAGLGAGLGLFLEHEVLGREVGGWVALGRVLAGRAARGHLRRARAGRRAPLLRVDVEVADEFLELVA